MKSAEVRSYMPEKKQRANGTGEGKSEEQQAVYATAADEPILWQANCSGREAS